MDDSRWERDGFRLGMPRGGSAGKGGEEGEGDFRRDANADSIGRFWGVVRQGGGEEVEGEVGSLVHNDEIKVFILFL
jgi:hypothetical protein